MVVAGMSDEPEPVTPRPMESLIGVTHPPEEDEESDGDPNRSAG